MSKWKVRSVPKDSLRFNTIAVFDKKEDAKYLIQLLKKSLDDNIQHWMEEIDDE